MVSFVILHYNDINITVQCVDNLLGLNNIEDSKIIIVDNASPNDTGIVLKEKYRSYTNIEVYLINHNLGFAKGNNVGYYYAKKNSDQNDYIIVMNNDVMIRQKDFIDVLEKSNFYNRYEIVLPDIINKVGVHQNPYRCTPLTTSGINKFLMAKVILLAIYSFPIISNIWANRHLAKSSVKKELYVADKSEMLIPHGSCVIFTRSWIEKEDIAFIPDTFMYHEEDILFEYVLNKKYKTIFNKELFVEHLEDASTNTIARTQVKKARFHLKHSIFPLIIWKRIRSCNAKGRDYEINWSLMERVFESQIE